MIAADLKPVFISYAHEDNSDPDPKCRWLDRMLQFLKPLENQVGLTVYSDQDIKAGTDWRADLEAQLKAAKVAVLMVSPAFLASEFIMNNELPVMLKLWKERELCIIPVIIKPCLYESVVKFPDMKTGPEEFGLGSIQSVNPPSKTLVDLGEADQNRVFADVAQRLKEVVQGTTSKPRQEAPPSGNNKTENSPIPRDVNVPERDKKLSALLQKVKKGWVETLLRNALHVRALSALGQLVTPESLPTRDMILRCDDNDPDGVVCSVTTVGANFDSLGGRLLIVGAKGSGRTTVFLELAQDLINRAEQDQSNPLPIPLSLASWDAKHQSFENWLIAEMEDVFGIKKELGKQWIDNELIFPMLDDLEEVPWLELRRCVDCINGYLKGLTIKIVICASDASEFRNIRLNVRNTLIPKLFSSEKINAWLEDRGSALAGIREAIATDTELKKLITSPLMLSIMSLTFREAKVEIPPKAAPSKERSDPLTERRDQVLHSYVQRAYADCPGETADCTREKVTEVLKFLAKQLSHGSQIYFHNRLQIHWLSAQAQRGYEVFTKIGGAVALWLMLTPFWVVGILWQSYNSGEYMEGRLALLSLAFALAAIIPALALVLGLATGLSVSLVTGVFVDRLVRRAIDEICRVSGVSIGVAQHLYTFLRVFLTPIAWAICGFAAWLADRTDIAPDFFKRFTFHIFLNREAHVEILPSTLDYAVKCNLLRHVGDDGYVFVHRLILNYFSTSADKLLTRPITVLWSST